mmetsp:Transcript_21697/g.48923  ORF Transcript_21697/g.48923 Transcript_21697/m.48923 type:complete len:350 (+) Transcript_21697:172-1221(+)
MPLHDDHGGAAPWMEGEGFAFEGLTLSAAEPAEHDFFTHGSESEDEETSGGDTGARLPGLPNEVLGVLFSQLEFAQVGRLANSSRRMHALVGHAENGDVWLALAKRAFPEGTDLHEGLRDAVRLQRGTEARRIAQVMCKRASCTRCRSLFRAGDAAECAVHTGVLISGHRTNGVNAGWTCCNSPRHAIGCVLGAHVRDAEAALYSEASKLEKTAGGCTGVPGSRVRGHTAPSHRTFLDLASSSPHPASSPVACPILATSEAAGPPEGEDDDAFSFLAPAPGVFGSPPSMFMSHAQALRLDAARKGRERMIQSTAPPVPISAKSEAQVAHWDGAVGSSPPNSSPTFLDLL